MTLFHTEELVPSCYPNTTLPEKQEPCVSGLFHKATVIITEGHSCPIIVVKRERSEETGIDLVHTTI